MSIKYKIAFLFALLVTFILVIVSLSVYLFSVKERTDNFRTRLKNRALSTAKIYADIKGMNLSVLQKLDTSAVASLYDKSISIAGYNAQHEYMFSDKPGDSMYLGSKVIERTKIEDDYYFTYKNKKAVAVHYIDSDDNFIVAVAAVDIDGMEYLRQLKKNLFLTSVLAVIISFLTGLLFAKNLVWPIKRITAEVNLITSSNLSQRIKINKAHDELTRLAQTFNTLLDRLQDSFTIQRRFISNASHELSTPLTSVSAQLEVSMQKDRSVSEYKDVLYSVHEDIKDLQQLTKSLLDIAKTGFQGTIDLSEVRIDEVLLKVAADVQKLDPVYKVIVEFETLPDDESQLVVFGNSNLLYMALKNIVENGCKYSDNHQAHVSSSFADKMIIISVASKGDVIAESDIQNIFQPFFRAASVQHKQGFGLGLTLTKRILSLHKGTIAVVSSPEAGTTFTIQIPVTTIFS